TVITHIVPGDVDSGTAVALQSDGRILAAGTSNNGGSISGFLARLLPDGTFDSDFYADGEVVVRSPDLPVLGDVALQTAGRIVAGGTNSTAGHFTLVRCNPDGSSDSSFGNGGITTTTFGVHGAEASAVALQADGKIVAAGSAFFAQGDIDF